MFVKEIRTDLLNVVRDEMMSGKMTLHRRNEIIDYLKRMVSKFRSRLYIPREIIAMRQLIEDLCDFEVYNDVNNEMLEEDNEALAEELNVSHKDEVFNQDDVPNEAEISNDAEVMNDAESFSEAEDITEEMPSETTVLSDKEDSFELEEHSKAEISLEDELKLQPEIPNEAEIQIEIAIQAEVEGE